MEEKVSRPAENWDISLRVLRAILAERPRSFGLVPVCTNKLGSVPLIESEVLINLGFWKYLRH
jgi:hypothetical protein